MNRNEFSVWLNFHRKKFQNSNSYLTTPGNSDMWFDTFVRFSCTIDELELATLKLIETNPSCYPQSQMSSLIDIVQKSRGGKYKTGELEKVEQWEAEREEFSKPDPKLDSVSVEPKLEQMRVEGSSFLSSLYKKGNSVVIEFVDSVIG